MAIRRRLASAVACLACLAAGAWFADHRMRQEPGALERAAELYEADWSATPLATLAADSLTLRICRVSVPSSYFPTSEVLLAIEYGEDIIRVAFELRENAYVETVAEPRLRIGYVSKASRATFGDKLEVELCLVEEALRAAAEVP